MTLARNLLFPSLIAAVCLSGCDSGGDGNAKTDGSNKKSKSGDVGGRPVARKKVAPTGICRIYTPDPGFAVFVDGEPVLDDKGERLTTPCAVTVPRGQHEITVAREGSADAHQFVTVGDDVQVEFRSIEKSAEGDASLLESAYLNQRTAEPVTLFSLNSDSQELDPYVTPDGRSLYFVSDRAGKRGVYRVTRKSAYDYFGGNVELVKSSSRLPVSPMISADSLSILYGLQGLGAVYHSSRETAVGEFGRGKPLAQRAGDSGRWISAQVIRDGERSWYLYVLQQNGAKVQGYSATATETASVGDVSGGGKEAVLKPLARQSFSVPARFDLRGNPPCLSADGLRQYTFDGKLLKRRTRTRLYDPATAKELPFSGPQLVSNVNLSDYQPTPNRRAYFLTNDEQWLFYESSGDLHMVRVSSGPGWGFVLRGRSIPPLPVKVAKLPKTKKPVDPVPVKPTIDPRTLPLPYPAFRKQLLALLSDRKYDAAKRHVQVGLASAELAKDRNLIAWDKQDVERTAAFWDDFERSVAKMKPGDTFSIGPVRVTFISYSAGTFVATAGTRRVTKKASEMRPIDVIAIVDKKLGRKDPTVQLHVGHVWYFDAKGSKKSGLSRLAKVPEDGAGFLMRLAIREAQQARHEFERSNIAQALSMSDDVLRRYPKGQAADDVRKLIKSAYSRMKWDAVGRRKWQQTEGAYTAAKQRVAGSLLRSPAQHENFELRLEWRSDVVAGQGGVFFRYPGTGNPTDTAFKIQFSDDFGVRADRLCTGALFKVQAPLENAVKPRGVWNTLRLRVESGKVRCVINGRTVLETTLKSETIPAKGYVALDGGLGGITYRRTLLYELPRSP